MGVRVSFLEQAAERNSRAAGTASAPPQGVLVPASAIVERDGKSVLFAIDGTHTRARPVSPGQSYGDLRLVEGITAGTHLVRSPPQPMNDGAAIVISKQ
jgi:multidrug efflux pump subunit AcrA (membrane-fusion protein)